eukprot:Pompholyxophrys_sp_v1_NODE_53_length_2879_cov_4.110127.p2 type:complete len:184 gc:universal NODE_53_length_2879_cov_4.110127:498-1049(+)
MDRFTCFQMYQVVDNLNFDVAKIVHHFSTEFQMNISEEKVRQFCSNLKSRLKSCSNNRKRFEKKNVKWLEGSCVYLLEKNPDESESEWETESDESPQTPTLKPFKKMGRPLKNESAVSIKTMYRRSYQLRHYLSVTPPRSKKICPQTRQKNGSPSHDTRRCISFIPSAGPFKGKLLHFETKWN